MGEVCFHAKLSGWAKSFTEFLDSIYVVMGGQGPHEVRWANTGPGGQLQLNYPPVMEARVRL